MRVSYIVALLMIVLMVGCAAPKTPETPPAAPATPPAAPATPPAAPATPPAEEEPVVTGDIVVTNAGFDPKELTVEVGSTLTVLAKEGAHKLTVGGTSTPRIEEGTGYDLTFSKLGKVTVFDIFTKKSAVVTVTEKKAATEETGAATE